MTLFSSVALAVTALACSVAIAADPPADGKEARRAFARACEADAAKLCANVEKGGGRKLMCLRSHATELSPGCRDAMAKADAERGAAPPK